MTHRASGKGQSFPFTLSRELYAVAVALPLRNGAELLRVESNDHSCGYHQMKPSFYFDKSLNICVKHLELFSVIVVLISKSAFRHCDEI